MILVILFATIIGSITGIGGGIILKPAFSIFTTYDPVTINLMVSYIIIIMTLYNSIFNYKSLLENIKIQHIFLVLGSILGSFIGNKILTNYPANIEVTQSILLSITIIIVLLITGKEIKYKLNRSGKNFLVLGFLSATISSFMGIGGGIFNVLIFRQLFKYSTQTSVALSLLLIFFTQITTIITLNISTDIIIAKNIIILYGIFAIIGSIIGARIKIKLPSSTIESIYKITLTIFIFINIVLIFI